MDFIVQLPLAGFATKRTLSFEMLTDIATGTIPMTLVVTSAKLVTLVSGFQIEMISLVLYEDPSFMEISHFAEFPSVSGN